MAKWGTNWHTPTRGQMEELIDKCTWEWTQVTGTHGYRVTGPSGNSIFLPAGGYREGESRRWLEDAGWYWTKTRENSLFGMRYFSLFLPTTIRRCMTIPTNGLARVSVRSIMSRHTIKEFRFPLFPLFPPFLSFSCFSQKKIWRLTEKDYLCKGLILNYSNLAN